MGHDLILKIKIQNKRIGEGEPTFIIAEAALTHEGSLDVARELIKSAARAKADAIKFQKFLASELVVTDHPYYERFKKVEFSKEGWAELVKTAKKFKITFFADVFDKPSADMLSALGVPAYKIHSTDIANPYLLSHVASGRKPIFLGVGGATLGEIGEAVGLIKSKGNANIVLMHGHQSYPTPPKEMNLSFIRTLKQIFKLNVGFLDHADPESDICMIAPAAAVALGASVVEKHITMNRGQKKIDYQSSLEPEEFREMVKNIRSLEKMLGSPVRKLSRDEMKYREEVMRIVVARADVPAGKRITGKMLAFKRSRSSGMSPVDAERIIGKIAKRKLKKDEPVTWGKVS